MLSKPITQRTILITKFSQHRKTPQSFVVSHISGVSTTTEDQTQNHNQTWRRQAEESRNVKVSVWWDFENCGLPTNGRVSNAFKVANHITAALRAHGIKGPVSITAYGDVCQISRVNQDALSCTGIHLTHVPHGGKNSADRSLLVDLMYWVSQNPPPAHIFLISGDRDFASTLHRLRMNNYNILLASPEHSHAVLCGAASIMWQWQALLKGVNLIGKHFNQPPDGSYNSWYGYSKVPVEDPYSTAEQTAPSRIEELSPIPRAVIKQLRQILSSHPNGISITDLRAELAKNDVSFDKNFCGRKKFSRFLLSMPHILRIKNVGDGQFLVWEVPVMYPDSTTFPKSPMPGESDFTSRSPESTGSGSDMAFSSFVDDGTEGQTSTAKLDSQDQSKAVDLDAKEALPPSPMTKRENILKKTTERHKEMEDMSGSVVADAADSNQFAANKQDKQEKLEIRDTTPEAGFLGKFWLKWFGIVDGSSMTRNPDNVNHFSASSISSCKDQKNTLEELNAVGDSPSKAEAVEKGIEPMYSTGTSVCSPVAASNDELRQENKADTTAEANVSLFAKIMNRFQFWGRDPGTNKLSNSTTKHEIFSKESFWSDVETFLDTPTGCTLVVQSETREIMADKFRKEGPLILRSLDTDGINHFVELLISEKKWVEECPTSTPSFKLTRLAVKTSSEQPRSNGLSSLFQKRSSQPDMEKLPKHDGLNRCEGSPHKGVSAHFTTIKPLERSRGEVLANCCRLVNHVLKEHPEGYNIHGLEKLFLERYNYPLDLEKLGYLNLPSLLQIMPGVRLESSYINPCNKVLKKVGEINPLPDNKQDDPSQFVSDLHYNSSDALKEKDDVDSAWADLGPVSEGSRRKDLETPSNIATGVTEGQKHHVYEHSLSDDDDEFSDTEPGTSAETAKYGERKSRINEEDSSLLQILDSWYGSKEGSEARNLEAEKVDGMNNYSDNGLEVKDRKESKNSRKLKTEKVDSVLDRSRDDLELPNSTRVSVKNKMTLGNCPKKHKPPMKEYLFVSDPIDGKKDKLIDGI